MPARVLPKELLGQASRPCREPLLEAHYRPKRSLPYKNRSNSRPRNRPSNNRPTRVLRLPRKSCLLEIRNAGGPNDRIVRGPDESEVNYAEVSSTTTGW